MQKADPSALATQGSSELAALLATATDIARAAAVEVMAVYASAFEAQRKDDASPLTQADLRAEALIVPALLALLPGVPVVAEEAASRGQVASAADLPRRFWLVDPLDGTREFVARNGEFTVNIALVEDGAPVLGVVLAPAIGRTFLGARGCGAWAEADGVRRAINCRAAPADGLVLACSRSHGDESAMSRWLGTQRIARRVVVGSSLKFGLIAAAEADLYPRLGRTMEWDTAAGHAVLAAAGGSVCDLAGQPLRYGKPGYENPHFVARGGV